MPGIDWSRYLTTFSQIETRQCPLDSGERMAVEALLADLLGFDPGTHWGAAGGFGNGTEVVVRLLVRPETASLRESAEGFTGPLAIRLMRTGKGRLTTPFHRQRARTAIPLNGPGDRHFQRDLAAGLHQGRFFVLHEWVEGETLEWLRRNDWATRPRPPSGTETEEILRQVLRGVVVPAWSEATGTSGVLWDIRDANFVVSNESGGHSPPRVVFVDTGNLRHLVDPAKNREGQIRNGLSRLRATMKRVLGAQGRWEGRPRSWTRRFGEILDASGLEQALRALPAGEGVSIRRAHAAALSCLAGLRDDRLFRPEDVPLESSPRSCATSAHVGP